MFKQQKNNQLQSSSRVAIQLNASPWVSMKPGPLLRKMPFITPVSAPTPSPQPLKTLGLRSGMVWFLPLQGESVLLKINLECKLTGANAFPILLKVFLIHCPTNTFQG